MLKVALFNQTAQPIPAAWLEHIQAEGDKDNEDGTTIEPVPASPQATLLDMARHSRRHFLSPQSPFASRCFLAADEVSIATKTVIIVNLTLAFLDGTVDADGPHAERDAIEGHMRVHPNSCIGFALIFDMDTQGIDKYDGIAAGAPDGILPRHNTPPISNEGALVTSVLSGPKGQGGT